MGFVPVAFPHHSCRVYLPAQSKKLVDMCNRTTNKMPDAAKVPPSRFQKRKGSIYATPSSRDGHIEKNYAEKYHAKIAEMKAGKAGRSATSEETSNEKY